MKPSFFLIGAPKCATTSWAKYLSSHSQISISDPKEPHYFCNDLRSRFHPRISNNDEYEELFAVSPMTRVAGEATPLYLYSDEAISRIRAYASEAKVIILLRRQPEFVWSLHQQFLYRRIEQIEDPLSAWRLSSDRDFSEYQEPELAAKLLDYRTMAHFEPRILRVLEVFPPSHVLVSWLEDWKHDPSGLWSKICAFIGVDHEAPPDFGRENEAKHHRYSWLSQFTNRPPPVLLGVARVIRKLLHLRRLRLAERIRDLNKQHGYRYLITPDIETEILEFYAESNQRLNAELTRLGRLYIPDVVAEMSGSGIEAD